MKMWQVVSVTDLEGSGGIQQIYTLHLSSLTLCPKAVLPLLSFLFRNLHLHSSLSGLSSWFFLSSDQEDDTENV